MAFLAMGRRRPLFLLVKSLALAQEPKLLPRFTAHAQARRALMPAGAPAPYCKIELWPHEESRHHAERRLGNKDALRIIGTCSHKAPVAIGGSFPQDSVARHLPGFLVHRQPSRCRKGICLGL